MSNRRSNSRANDSSANSEIPAPYEPNDTQRLQHPSESLSMVFTESTRSLLNDRFKNSEYFGGKSFDELMASAKTFDDAFTLSIRAYVDKHDQQTANPLDATLPPHDTTSSHDMSDNEHLPPASVSPASNNPSFPSGTASPDTHPDSSHVVAGNAAQTELLVSIPRPKYPPANPYGLGFLGP